MLCHALFEGFHDRDDHVHIGHLAGDGGDEDADSGSDQGAGVPDCGEALGLDEHGHLGRELGEVRLDVVLEDEAGQRPCGVILVSHLGQDVDQIVVEVWILIELLQLGLDFSLRSCIGTLGFLKVTKFNLCSLIFKTFQQTFNRVRIWRKPSADGCQSILTICV